MSKYESAPLLTLMVKELNELLNEAKINPPHILVGDSFGGGNARLYATEYPNEIGGLILVDSAQEDKEKNICHRCQKSFKHHTTNNLFTRVIIMNLWKV